MGLLIALLVVTAFFLAVWKLVVGQRGGGEQGREGREGEGGRLGWL